MGVARGLRVYPNFVDYLSIQKGIQHPREVGGVDAVHGGARANDWIQAENDLVRVVLGEAVDQAYLSADGPLAAGRGLVDRLANDLGGAVHVRGLDRFEGALRVYDHGDVRVPLAGGIYLPGGEAGMH